MNFAFQTLWWGIKESFYQIGRLIVLNVSWILFSLPIVTIPAATLGMAYAIRVMVIDETNYSWKVFIEGFKRYLLAGWRWFIPSLLLPIIFIYNILFFAVENFTLSIIIQAANIVMLVVWSFLQTFTIPLLVEQEKPNMRVALLNGVKILYQKPGIYWFTSIFLTVFLIFSTFIITPIIIFSISMSLFISMYCLQVFLGRRGIVPDEESSKVYKKPGSK